MTQTRRFLQRTLSHYAALWSCCLMPLWMFSLSTSAASPGEVQPSARPSAARPSAGVGWPSTEGAPGGGRYSPLAEINRDNVAQLKIAWTYRHGDQKSGGFLPDKVNRGTAFEGTPNWPLAPHLTSQVLPRSS